jgi:hypothetical protein
MKIVIYVILFLGLAATLYFFVKIVKDSKKDLLKTMLRNNDISNETYLKYLDRL